MWVKTTSDNIGIRWSKAIVGTSSVLFTVRPLSLELSGVVHHVVQGTKVTLECAVLGARPAANVTWYNGSEPISEESLRTDVALQVRLHIINDISVVTFLKLFRSPLCVLYLS